ncbi:MAG: trigger factor [Frankiales bacterium]|nr:trigger factor [Frankiales bacterium]
MGAGDREFESPRPDRIGVLRPRTSALDPAVGGHAPVTVRGHAHPPVRPAPTAEPAAEPGAPIHVKSAVETLSPSRVKLTVEVPFEELKPALDAAYKRIADQITVPGFRKGKVPNRIIDQRIGRAAVLDEAINDAINLNLDSALRENDIKLLGRPEVDVTAFEDAKPLEFTAEMDVVPEFELPSYDSIEVVVDPSEVTDDDVATQLDALRSRFGSLTTVERAATTGDVLLFDISGETDGEAVEDLEAKALSYELGTDGMLPGFDEALEGVSAGETRTFAFTPETGEYEGRDITVTVVVSGVRERVLPTADDDFAQLASEFDTIDELRADLRERVGRVKLLEQAYAAREKVAEALLAATEIALPEGVITQQVEDHFADGHGDDAHRTEVETQTRDSLKSQLVLDRIAETEQLSVSEAELSSWLVQQAPRYGMSPDQFAQELVSSGQVPAAVAEVRRAKALAHVLEHARVTDTTGAVVDLSSLDADEVPVAEDGHDHEGHDHDHEGHDHE